MKRILLALLALGALEAHAAVRCSGSPCADSTGGDVTGSGTNTFTSTNCYGGVAGTANGFCIQSVGGAWSIVSEGISADASELTVSFGEHTADQTLTLTAITDAVTMTGGAAGNIDFLPAGYFMMRAEGTAVGTLRLRSTVPLCWATGIPSANCDSGILRNSLGGGITVVSNTAGTTIGFLSSSQLVQPQITTYTTTAPESGGLYTNTGDTDGATITLLNDPTLGVWYDFAVTAAFTLTLQPSAGEVLYGAAGATCSTLASNVVGSIAHIVATTGGSGALWMTQLNGTWICSP